MAKRILLVIAVLALVARVTGYAGNDTIDNHASFAVFWVSAAGYLAARVFS